VADGEGDYGDASGHDGRATYKVESCGVWMCSQLDRPQLG
jgi:hypothetical protein